MKGQTKGSAYKQTSASNLQYAGVNKSALTKLSNRLFSRVLGVQMPLLPL